MVVYRSLKETFLCLCLLLSVLQEEKTNQEKQMFQSCGKKDERQPPVQLHNTKNMMLMFLCCRWCHVSASQSCSNWFHTCLYHIINESTRRKTAVASDRLRGEKRKRNILLPWPQFSQNKGLTFSSDSIFKVLWLWPRWHFFNALKALRDSVCLFLLPIVFQSPSATTIIIFCIGEDFLPLFVPDTTISQTIRSSLWVIA